MKAPENKGETGGPHDGDEHHAGHLDGSLGYIMEHFQVEFFVQDGQQDSAHGSHGSGFRGRGNTGEDGAEDGQNQEQRGEKGFKDSV